MKFKLKSRNFLRVISLFKFNEEKNTDYFYLKQKLWNARKKLVIYTWSASQEVKDANYFHILVEIKKFSQGYLPFQTLWEKFANYFQLQWNQEVWEKWLLFLYELTMKGYIDNDWFLISQVSDDKKMPIIFISSEN